MRVLALLAPLVMLAAAGEIGAQESREPESRAAPSRRSSKFALRETEWLRWDVGGVSREAIIHRPSKNQEGPSPLVFGFHGHGGSAANAARSFQIHEQWPEAMVVYMQGLPTPLGRFDPEGRQSGWQTFPGDQGDRDLAFFDVALASLKVACKIDEDRVYATGHSNGGAFTYLLWAKRADVFAAFAPSASGSWSVLSLPPKPAMHIAGRKDTLVPFDGQMRTMMVVRARNGCTGPQEWAPACTLYPSTKGAPFVACIHPGDHRYPAEAPPLVVRFFKEHTRPTPSGAESRR